MSPLWLTSFNHTPIHSLVGPSARVQSSEFILVVGLSASLQQGDLQPAEARAVRVCGETAWMRSLEDVKAVLLDQYAAGGLDEFTKDMSNSTYSQPWPPIADHLTNLAIDKDVPHSSLASVGLHSAMSV